MNIEYTCIKGKSKGTYKNVHEEKPETPVVYPEIDTDIDQPDFDGYPQEIDYPDYGEDYGFMGVYSEIDRVDFHLLRNSLFKHDNKDCTILESTYYQDLDILVVFGLPPFGEKETYCIWQFKDYCTDLLFVGKKDQVYQKYKPYCGQVRREKVLQNTGFMIPVKEHLREYRDRLEPDGRYFPKKQLNIFG